MTTFLGFALSALLAPSVFAATLFQTCPVPVGWGAGGETVAASYLTDTGGTGPNYNNATAACNVLITFNSNGSVTTTNPNGAGFYDSGTDDNLVGIVNNSGHSISSVVLSSASTDIFGFEGDGICTSGGTLTFAQTSGAPAAGACTGATDPNGYGGPGVTYSGINGAATLGTVNFAGGIASGGAGWFSLEGPVALDLVVNPTPEPGTLTLVGAGCLALGFFRRRRLAK